VALRDQGQGTSKTASEDRRMCKRWDTLFRSPQLELIELDDEQWRKCQRRPLRTYSRRRTMFLEQLSLLDLGTSALLLLALKAM